MKHSATKKRNHDDLVETSEREEPIRQVPPSYPSSATIPFPIPSGPYPQQAQLMDAMLQTLQLIDDMQDPQPQGKDAGVAESHVNNNNNNNNNCYQGANIMMLESPTGTGKSLSLACASIAWLKYREAVDMGTFLSSPTDLQSSEESKASNHDNRSCPEDIHWLDAWAPPHEIERKKQNEKKREDCARRARYTRRELEKELDRIRQDIRHHLHVMGEDTGVTNERKQQGSVVRRARELAVQKTRQDFRKNHHHHRQGFIKDRVSSKNKILSSHNNHSQGECTQDNDNESKTNGTQEQDYCLEEYLSDTDKDCNKPQHGGTRPSKNSRLEGYKYGYSSEEDEYGDINQTASDYHSKASASGSVRKKLTSKELLDGGQLDGSGNIQSHQKFTSQEIHDHKPVSSIGDVQPGSGVRKIIYAARTHSQLSQFVGEIRRTVWGNTIRVVTLGGRKLLCGNSEVVGPQRNSSEATITEKCLDMQKGMVSNTDDAMGKKKKNGKTCPLLVKDFIPTLALHMLAQPSDIEDLVALGQKSNACSYYASRESLNAAEVVVVPYNTLLSKPAREAVGLSLKSSLVIIDEAHNIPEALRSISSSKLTLPVIDGAISQLVSYVNKYSNRLAGRNLFYLGQIRRFLTQAGKFLRLGQRKADQERTMVTSTELLFTLKLDNLNVFSILQYLQKSKLSQKLHGFNSAVLKEQNSSGSFNADDPGFVSKHISSMSIVESFLKCLTSTQEEGRVIIERPKETSSDTNDSRSHIYAVPCYRFLLLDPSNEFKNVLNEAHAVVLAGGTLRPFVHMATELFGFEQKLVAQAKRAELEHETSEAQYSYSTISRTLTTFTCDHVVPSRNVLMISLPTGPKNVTMDFRHSSRFQESICDELSEAILRISNEVPNGMVVFLPSYSYESFLMKRWMKTGAYDEMKSKKRLFREPQSAKDVETTLSAYSIQANSERGAMLFCVVGGKMSEGINFANEMARCVMIVGLPYPDITDPELKEKMKVLDDVHRTNEGNPLGITGKEYYQNLCMRAVNQSVGRAIRHEKDYAAIVLVDVRYSTDPRVWKGLPKWLRSDEKQCYRKFDENTKILQSFYANIDP